MINLLHSGSMRAAILMVVMCAAVQGRASAQPARVPLAHWQLQSSEKVQAGGQAISRRTFRPSGWLAASVPTTVLAALVANKVYPDPFFGMNLRSIPGASYPIGRNFSKLDMPDDSPFRVSWWFRTAFELPAGVEGRHVALHLDGINYRANIWLNGRRVAASDDVAGMYRLYEFDVTRAVRARGANVLAVEVFPPGPDDLACTWVDWNPAPPDKNMGLWRPAYLTVSGDVAVRHLHVVSRLEQGLRRAQLTVSAELRNLTTHSVRGKVAGRIDEATEGAAAARPAIAEFSENVRLAPGETRTVRFLPGRFPQLKVARPRLWWPAEMGAQHLHRLSVEFGSGDTPSDRQETTFGIREITSEMTEAGVRLFKVNGRPLLVRGGGWAPDMLLRASPERQAAEIQYVRDMHLNTIRLEGKLEDDNFFELTDRRGILVLAGWCCCDAWEQWDQWKPANRAIAAAAERDQVRRLRTHPSILAWLNGSDNPPPADIERMYVDILDEFDWPNPYLSSATAKQTTVTGETGVKMTGPYDWVPPSYWLREPAERDPAGEARGGAHGFNTETSPGAAVPPIESLRRMLPADHLWPIDDVWNYHAGGGQFRTIQRFSDALTARYGAPSGVEDYARTAQLMTYEGERAMFEAFARNKYTSTGVIQWMLNNAWPSLVWHLYDYYLRPGGGYFGTKKACEPLHAQYSYDDRSVVVINNTLKPVNARVVARVLGTDSSEKFSREAAVQAQPDTVVRAFQLPEIAATEAAPETYFVDLRLLSSSGETLGSNLYWLSTTPDEPDWQNSTWFTTPVKRYADFTALRSLPAATVTSSMTTRRQGDEEHVSVTLRNPGRTLAFFVRLQITQGTGGDEVLPVLWEDNYVTLLPGETRTVTATCRVKDLGGRRPALAVSGWNIAR